jgi:hypothetical protein
VRRAHALALAMLVSLAWAQAPAQNSQKNQKNQKAQKTQKAQPPQKPHAKPTPEQIRRFNELQKQNGKR